MDKTRKPSPVMLALLSALATLPFTAVRPDQGLQAQPSPEPIPTFTPPNSLAQGTSIIIDGSPSMAIINRSLEAGFEQQYPGTDVVISTNGDEAALQALQAGTIDLAALGRPLTEAELAQNLTEVPISREKIAVIVGRDNAFQGDLTFEDFARIFWGEVTNWSQLGGPNLPLRFIDRPADSDTRIALSDYDVFKRRAFETGETAVQVADDDTAAVVRELGNNGISYAIAGEIIDQDAVRPLSMHSTLPDDPRYPYSQPRGYVYQGEPSIQVEAFLGYATNPNGQQDIADAKATEKANVTAGAGQLPEEVALSPDGSMMVRGTQDGQLHWLNRQGRPTNLVVPEAHTGTVTDVIISPDGQTIVSSGADGLIRRWDRTGNPIGDPILGSGGPVLSLALSPDGSTIVSGNANGTVERWSLADGSPMGNPIAAHDGPVQTISYPPGGQNFITGSSDGTISLWNTDGSLATKVVDAHKGGITDITSSPDGQTLITAGDDGTIRQWDRATLRPRGEALSAHNSPISAVAVSPNGSTIATTARDSTLQLWEPTGTPRLPGAITLAAPASSLAYNPEGQLVVGTSAGQVDLLDADGNSLTATAPNGGGLPELFPDLVRRIQNLPRETWWMLGVIPLLLILAGILGAMLGIKPKGNDDGLEGDEDKTPGLAIDFSGLGNSAVVNREPGSGSVDHGLPPEASLVPMEGNPIGSSSLSKLEQARADLAEGKRLMREGHYDSALIYFNSAIEATEVERYKAQASGNMLGGVNAIAAQAQAQRGNALIVLGQTNEALDSFNTALEIDASCIEAWIGKGRLLTSLGRPEEAVFCFDTALEMDSSSGAAWAGKGQAMMQMGRQAEAQDCLSRAAALGHSTELGGPSESPFPGIEGAVPNYPAGAGYGSEPYAPSSVPTYPPSGVTALNYDPDVPLELQQAIAAIPSEDIILPETYPGQYDMPPEVLATADDLPGTAGLTGSEGLDFAPGTGSYPSSPPPPTMPGLDSAESLIEGANLPPAHDLDEMLAALDLPNGISELSPPPPPPPPASSGTLIVPLEPGDFVPPPPESMGAPATNPWAGLPPEVIAAMASIPPDSPDSFGFLPQPDYPVEPNYPVESDYPVEPNYPVESGYPAEPSYPVESRYPAEPDYPVESGYPTEPDYPVEPDYPIEAGDSAETGYSANPPDTYLFSPPIVPLEPGDFIPPPPLSESPGGMGTATVDLPPEVLAAMASIPPTSPDSFNLPPSAGTPATVTPEPAAVTGNQSWIQLSLDQGGKRFYALWNLDPHERTQAQARGGQTLALRLFDVTGKSSSAPLADPVTQVECGDASARDWYIDIPALNRIYLAEVGFLGADQRWYGVAHSNALPAIS